MSTKRKLENKLSGGFDMHKGTVSSALESIGSAKSIVGGMLDDMDDAKTENKTLERVYLNIMVAIEKMKIRNALNFTFFEGENGTLEVKFNNMPAFEEFLEECVGNDRSEKLYSDLKKYLSDNYKLYEYGK